MSAPCSIGRHSTGVANVLSTTQVSPAARPAARSAGRSPTAIVGLAIVSRKSSRDSGRSTGSQLRPVPPRDVADINAVAAGQAGEHGERAAVQAPLRDDVVARAQQGEQHRIDGAHAGTGRDRRRAPFQVGDRVLERAGGGVPVQAVGEPGAGTGAGFRERLRVGEREGRGLVNRDADRAGAVQLGRGGMDGAGFQVQVHGTDSARPGRPAVGRACHKAPVALVTGGVTALCH